MRRIVLATVLAAFGLTGSALAACDVELAFSPDAVAPGDEVTMFASIANLGDEDVIADLEVMITFLDYEVGPFFGQLPLAAGEELSQEMVFVAPALPMGGTLTITVTATCGEYSDTATATLTLEAGDGEGYGALDGLGEEIINTLGSPDPTGSETTTLGNLKAQYR